jgi:hypothetical protein
MEQPAALLTKAPGIFQRNLFALTERTFNILELAA